MKKDSENKGITKVCPTRNCGNIVFSGGEFSGIGSLKIKCEKCKRKVRINFGFMAVVKVVLVVLFLTLVLNIKYKIEARRNINCDSFKTQSQAQNFFNRDNVRYSYLDRNHDGLACQDLPS